MDEFRRKGKQSREPSVQNSTKEREKLVKFDRSLVITAHKVEN